ncbi:MAG: pyroglutamyl-peptidase I [Armatimonadota bacterium]
MNAIVLTGFGRWGEEKYNSSWEILRDADIDLPDGWQCIIHQLPVSWVQAPMILETLFTPDVKAVLCFGMTGGNEILVERLASNLIIPDLAAVDDIPHTSEYVCPDGPPAYYSGLPYQHITAVLQSKGIPCDTSLWAGPHTCNFIFYWLMHYIAKHRPDMVGGFIHVPPFEQHGGLDRAQLCSGVEIIVQTVISHIDDII